ncbi:MAG: hypothetical protein B7Y41_04770 [Hydrogenophilales bacterium 28-61-23]|nr:MAG: hypothetical protein B7Y41_04770 [Hydrogenophilales bacterium 28-61-23]
MKQLVVTPSFPFSTHTFVTREIASTVSAGHAVTVLAPTSGDAEGQVLADRLGVKLEEVIYLDAAACPVFSTSLKRYGRSIRKSAMRGHYGRLLAERRKTFFTRLLRMPRIREVEQIHAHFMGWAFEVALPLGQLLNVPVTLTVHNVDLPSRAIDELLYLQRYAARIVLVSQAYHRIWAERTGTSDRLAIVPNGIELAEFAAGSDAPPGAARLNIISISRLVPGKRIGDVLYALANLRDQSIDFSYVSIGEGAERTALEQLAARLGLTDRVTFLGAMPHAAVVKALCASDILLHPSEWESFGIVVAEAMAANVAVIAARSPGPGEIVQHGVTGFLYEPGDVETLSVHLKRLAADPELRKQFGELGRVRVLNQFSWAAHMSQMLELWRDTISAVGGGNDPTDRQSASLGSL